MLADALILAETGVEVFRDAHRALRAPDERFLLGEEPQWLRPRRSRGAAADRVAGSSQAMLVVDDEGAASRPASAPAACSGPPAAALVGRPIDDSPRARVAASASPTSGTPSARRGGHAGPFALEAPATVVEVARDRDRGVLPSRHLITLDAGAAAAPERRLAGRPEGRPRAGARQPRRASARSSPCSPTGPPTGRSQTCLELSPATVQTHVRNAKAKLGARTRAQAVAIALQRGHDRV